MPRVQYSNNLGQLWRVSEPYGRLTKLTHILKGMFPFRNNGQRYYIDTDSQLLGCSRRSMFMLEPIGIFGSLTDGSH